MFRGHSGIQTAYNGIIVAKVRMSVDFKIYTIDYSLTIKTDKN